MLQFNPAVIWTTLAIVCHKTHDPLKEEGEIVDGIEIV